MLVMKVALAKGETVELATGGRLESLIGVLRIRERKTNGTRGNGAIGSLISYRRIRSRAGIRSR